MGANSRISWTDHTWTLTTGCTEVSRGCRNCYARTFSTRLAAMAERKARDSKPVGKLDHYRGVTHDGKWTGTIRLIEEALDEPRRWRKPRRVFVNSMSDLFHDLVPVRFIGRAFSVMSKHPQHTFQILTKRPKRMLYLLAAATPQPNIWLGTSAEDRRRYHERWRWLKQLKENGWTTFVSAEPLLGPIIMGQVKPDWVIVGGESGPHARPMNPEWVVSLRKQCDLFGVPFFFKQWGTYGPDGKKLLDPKRDNHILNGKVVQQYPQPSSVAESMP